MDQAATDLKTIVIVEDEEALASIFKDEISYFFPHYSVMCFTSSLEALGFFKEQPVDLIITDGKMPQLSGIELARNLKEKGIKTPLFLVTGHVDFLEEIKDENIFEKIYEKPVDFDLLLKDIKEKLSS